LLRTSFIGPSAAQLTNRIEHIAADILASGIRPTASPSPCFRLQKPSGCQGFVTRYSGATVPDSHGIPVAAMQLHAQSGACCKELHSAITDELRRIVSASIPAVNQFLRHGIRDRTQFVLANLGKPIIYVSNANHQGRGALYLGHIHEGMDLRFDYMKAQKNLQK